MKSNLPIPSRTLVWIAVVALQTSALAITFTTDTTIGAFDTNYDGADIAVTNCTLTVDGVHSFASLQVLNGARLTHTACAGMNLTVTGDVLIETGGAINLDGRGFGGGEGPGPGSYAGGTYFSGSGAGHGGYGGLSSSNAPGGTAYGSTMQPVHCGSGGGAIRLTVGGELRINGNISATGSNGVNTRSGGGAGGSIWLTAQTISGSGAVSANGGAGEPPHGGGGGGGRIALEYATNSHSGPVTACGGGSRWGGAGTIYRTIIGQAGDVLVDNGGHPGTNTLLQITNGASLAVRGAAIGVPSGAQTLGSLLVASNSWLKSTSLEMTLATAGNATIENGGGILADGMGYPPGQGYAGGYGRTYVIGSTYQLYASTNLLDWEPCGATRFGSNAAFQIPIPVTSEPKRFFQVQAGN
jgi:hypothetical protein